MALFPAQSHNDIQIFPRRKESLRHRFVDKYFQLLKAPDFRQGGCFHAMLDPGRRFPETARAAMDRS